MEAQHYSGYDPYDGLNIFKNRVRPGLDASRVILQVMKRLPINIRPLLRMPRRQNPKALGLVLKSLVHLYRLAPDQILLDQMDRIVNMLVGLRSPGFTPYCWGYPFEWISARTRLPAFSPNIVVTATVGKALADYYQLTHHPECLSLLKSIPDFILEHLPHSRFTEGICFSYTPYRRDCIYNASLLGAELCARVGALCNRSELFEWAHHATMFVEHHIHTDGHWAYSLDPLTQHERYQVDFHQGFILESLYELSRLLPQRSSPGDSAVQKGLLFYKNNQFSSTGRSMWRLPRKWPADIHHQAQGIIVFAKLKAIDADGIQQAQTILKWTCNHLYRGKGQFSYQKWPMFTNPISYHRWGQAWMLLAICEFITSQHAGMKFSKTTVKKKRQRAIPGTP